MRRLRSSKNTSLPSCVEGVSGKDEILCDVWKRHFEGAMSMVRQPIGPTTHWSENPLVRRPIGPKTHRSKDPLVQKCHWSENHWSEKVSLVRKPIGPKIAEM